ncbi:hypothetical protein, conserved [Trypanosoma brucei gambiense DAL972]|uniref:EFHB C-terminal EF-hand domain-containing protein n=1 Tax=Trypanosoma brucei gambiense (strain MHOM/CI/86/DAL972) TaxID=679716 RepID=D0A8L4_TRYB9|nr:hypothetical protein, conserved [Trypanosoma brucei gambiense DAL972]CBH18015.1 hypothetical protein, conserved [Trypanosoma brucei gambiense DAL972]|eukprot:XP_011780279.1 hypothetical protein, conserved [Trypanosoma brucei gambiense DAL972]
MSSPMCSVHSNPLGGSRSRLHIAPQIIPAGRQGSRDGTTVRELTSNHYSSGRVTPELQRTYHRFGEVGCTRHHYGRARDPPIDETFRHGIRTEAGEGARGCLQPETGGRMMALMEQQLERAYLSNVRRPLGKVPAAMYDVQVPHSGFGIPSEKSESVKTLLYAGRDSGTVHPVGECKNRGYDWERAGINPMHHRFGWCEQRGEATAGEVMCETKLVTRLLPKVVTDVRKLTKQEVGKGLPPPWDTKYFDDTLESRTIRRNGRGEGDAVRQLLSSWMHHPFPPKRQLVAEEEDASLKGTGSLEGSRKEGLEKDALRSRFLCTYRRGGRYNSADHTRLDDDVRAPHVLYPCHYVQMGVNSSRFAGGCTLENVRDLCKSVGMDLAENQMQEVFNHVAVDGVCGIEQFKNKAVEMGYLS